MDVPCGHLFHFHVRIAGYVGEKFAPRAAPVRLKLRSSHAGALTYPMLMKPVWALNRHGYRLGAGCYR